MSKGCGAWMLMCLAFVAIGCGPAPEDPTADLRLNEIQVIGSHNSYKIKPSDGLQRAIEWVVETFASDLEGVPSPQELEYTHPSIAEQLGPQGLRQLELDVWVDPEGGLYADPFGPGGVATVDPFLPDETLLPGPDFDPEGVMSEPGQKTLHIQDIDFRSHCLTFMMCLEQVRDWSQANPDHLPIFILVELKAEFLDLGETLALFDLEFTIPEPWALDDLLELQDGIRTVFSDNEIILPNDVRRGYPTLMEAIQAEGWLPLDRNRGKVWFGLDNGGSILDAYVAQYPGLDGAYLFTSSPIDSPEAAFRKENDPAVSDPSIAELVEQGFLVRTRADADTVESRQNDPTRRDLAFASGAQFISTDYREPNSSFSPYSVQFPGLPEGTVARCDPVLPLEGCVSEDIAP
ncbi:MAG: hypothetical protein CBC48_19800 [bacterium TMED88]|nr:hypothetical protein [Deltaproteobacteria bacterium]OUV21976.1 MAG: hypothetical protein CBC48_19800 [bacterium TMED88]